MLLLVLFRLQFVPGLLAQASDPGWETLKSLGLPAFALLVGMAAMYRGGIVPLRQDLKDERARTDEANKRVDSSEARYREMAEKYADRTYAAVHELGRVGDALRTLSGRDRGT